MTTYPTLYALSSTGKTLVLWIEQDGDKYRASHGQQGGKIVVDEWTVAQPKNVGKKNETTGEQQAALEVAAKYEKKLKSGGYCKDVKDINKEKFFQVMLAKSLGDYEDKIDWSKGVGVQIKFNGGRALATKNGIFSRKGERYMTVPHIEKALAPFFEKYPNAKLDGEFFRYELREQLNKIMELIRRSVHITPQHLADSEKLVRFYVYDGFGFGAKDTDNYITRKAMIERYVVGIPYVEEVKTIIVYSKAELDKVYQTFLADKQEGAIIRILDAPYEQKRSQYLLKYKPIHDQEYKIVAIYQGDGNWAGRLAKVTCKRIDGKKYLDGTDTFDATFKGTSDDAIAAWNNGEANALIGKKVTIYFNGETGYGKPNYARLDWANYLKE